MHSTTATRNFGLNVSMQKPEKQMITPANIKTTPYTLK